MFHSPPVSPPKKFMLTLYQPPKKPNKIKSYKKTVVYDPLKSETYRALQESSYAHERVQEVAAPVQPRVFQPNRLVPGKVRHEVIDGTVLLDVVFLFAVPETSVVFSTTRSHLETSRELIGRGQRRHSPKRIVQAINVSRFGRNRLLNAGHHPDAWKRGGNDFHEKRRKLY